MKNDIVFIGLTGGIGSGKSLVSKIIRSFGFLVYDSDFEAKNLMENNFLVKKQLLETFGGDVFINEKLNRNFLAQKVFSDKNSLEKINKIVHSAVFKHFEKWAETQKQKIVFMESAIIFENSLEKYFDKIISVISPQELKIQRVMQRTNMSCTEVKQRIFNQFADEILIQKSDFVLINNEKEALLPQIVEIINKITKAGKTCRDFFWYKQKKY